MPLISAVLEEDCGNFGMPELGYFLAGNVLDLVVSQDATGFGSLSIATCVLNNPYTPHSAQNLRRTYASWAWGTWTMGRTARRSCYRKTASC